MKIYLTILLSLLLAPILAFAAYNDVSISDSAVISVGGSNLVVSGTANIDSIVVDSNSFVVTLSQNAELVVTSADKLSFGVYPVEYKKSFVCGSSNSTLTIGNANRSTTETATIEVSSPCSSGTSGSGGGGMIISGGGGGGGGSTAPSVAPQVAQPSPVAQIVSPVFNTTLKYGMTSDDVSRLQQLLTSDPEVYPEGIVSGWFGQLTRKAVQKFQEKYGIEPIGIVGPQTRAKLNEVFAQATPTAPSVAQPSPVAISVSPVFTIGFSKGTTNTDVKRLQQLLNSDPDTKIAESGAGSPGNETEYFGALTEKALQKFQKKYNIAKEGEPGYGYLGPKTRAKLQEVFKQNP